VTDCQAHRLGAVPVFDFDNPTEREVFCAAKMGWAGFLFHECGITVWLRIPVSRLEPGRLMFRDTEVARKNPLVRDCLKWIPYVEAWHPGPIDWQHVDHVYAVSGQQCGEDQSRMVPLDIADAVSQVRRIREEWELERPRQRALDRAAGKISIADILKDARTRISIGETSEPENGAGASSDDVPSALNEARERVKRMRAEG